MGIRFRLTFHHSSPGFFRFDEQSVPLDLGDELTLNLTARDADTLAKAKRFHIEGRGFASEEAARSVGERLRLRLRVLNSLLGLGITVPVVDSRRAAVADAVKEKVRRETGGVIVDTIEGLAVISDDPDHFEQVVAGGASVYPSDPAYVLTALAVVWPVEMQLDERAEDALEILGVATTELSPRAKFLTTYLALERMIDRLTRSEAAQKLIEELQDRVQESALDGGDKKSLVSSLGNLREQSFRTALFALVARLNPAPTIDGMPARKFLSECVDIRNTIAHNAMLGASVDLAKASDGLRHFIMSLIWTMNGIPDVSVNVPPSTVQLDALEMRMI
ncbi:MAG: hypothetical protein WBX00_25200 [Isosphaeraceae bacterium]